MESDLDLTAGAKSTSQALKMDVNSKAALYLQVHVHPYMVIFTHVLTRILWLVAEGDCVTGLQGSLFSSLFLSSVLFFLLLHLTPGLAIGQQHG